MKESTEELKAIIAGAPVGAKSISEHTNAYVKRHDGSFYWWDGSGWQNLLCHIGARSLSDIEEIIKLREFIAGLQLSASDELKANELLGVDNGY